LTAKASVRMDSKQRIVLSKRLRKASGIERGDESVAIPFHGGFIIAPTTGKGFAGSLTGFQFNEGTHEATKYLGLKLKHADP
jgi:bifunctional DNA-binding transcriptional regulator/antitoxin component of YhaV-PrlF toxin-antitoxin module